MVGLVHGVAKVMSSSPARYRTCVVEQQQMSTFAARFSTNFGLSVCLQVIDSLTALFSGRWKPNMTFVCSFVKGRTCNY